MPTSGPTTWLVRCGSVSCASSSWSCWAEVSRGRNQATRVISLLGGAAVAWPRAARLIGRRNSPRCCAASFGSSPPATGDRRAGCRHANRAKPKSGGKRNEKDKNPSTGHGSAPFTLPQSIPLGRAKAMPCELVHTFSIKHSLFPPAQKFSSIRRTRFRAVVLPRLRAASISAKPRTSSFATQHCLEVCAASPSITGRGAGAADPALPERKNGRFSCATQ